MEPSDLLKYLCPYKFKKTSEVDAVNLVHNEVRQGICAGGRKVVYGQADRVVPAMDRCRTPGG
jgi:hypothetical protein